MPYDKLLHQTQESVHTFAKTKYPWIDFPKEWDGIVTLLQSYKPRIHFLAVRWELPEQGWIKCNTDGASRGNPGESSYAFCIRNTKGDLVEAKAQCIRITTNMEAKTMAMVKALRKCK